jgi:hypothetical protein|tara:strand:+ start:2400 stop:2807 length:408 start_codon:yes stop_codon:yes gene_type:complete
MLGLIDRLIGPVSTILDKVVSDKDLKEKLAHDIATMAERHGHDVIKAQIEVNKEEAKHRSLFVSGWRPAVGWTCTLALLSNFILIPMTNFILVLADSDIAIPLIDVSTMMPVLMGMLGLGTMRTVEKINKVERNT